MTVADLARLASLACLWSLQFMFLRVAVPAFGAPLVVEARCLLGALIMVPAALLLSQRIAPLAQWRSHLAISLANNVVPFLLFAYAARSLPAGYLAIVNGTVPLWTAVFSAWLLGEALGMRRLLGFVLGIAGVGLIVRLGPVAVDAEVFLAAGAVVLGAALWAYAGVLIKQTSAKLPPVSLAAGSIAYSAVLLSPAWAATPHASWSLEAAGSVVGLGVLCTGVAYFFFFRLVRDIGPSRTLSIGFVIPALGVFWGWLILGEPVTLSMLAGGALVLIAMAMVLRH